MIKIETRTELQQFLENLINSKQVWYEDRSDNSENEPDVLAVYYLIDSNEIYADNDIYISESFNVDVNIFTKSPLRGAYIKGMKSIGFMLNLNARIDGKSDYYQMNFSGKVRQSEDW